MKFRTFTAGSWFTIGVAALLLVGSLVALSISPSLQSTVVSLAVITAAVYIGGRYVQARRRLAMEHVAYNSPFDFNVFAADQHARERWSFGTSTDILRAYRAVVDRTGCDPKALCGLTIRVVSEPFKVPGLPGLNRGVTYPDRSAITVAWLDGEASPFAVLCHELAHVVLGRRDGTWDQEASHARMQELGWPW